jgi:hypothetical protein
VRNLVLALISVLCAAGCVSTFRQSGVEQLGPSQKASIEIENPLCPHGCVSISSVDGVSRGIGWFGTFELAPGSHEIACEDITLTTHGSPMREAILQFTAKAGRIYQIRRNSDFIPEIVDAQGDRVVSRVISYQLWR